jgi:hypothetical protein
MERFLMAQLIIENENLAFRLLRLAQAQDRSVEAVLDELLRTVEQNEHEESGGAKLARLAAEADLVFSDIPETTDYDAILKQDMADDLWRRMDRGNDGEDKHGD